MVFFLEDDSGEWAEEGEYFEKYQNVIHKQLTDWNGDEEKYLWLKFFAHNKQDILSLARDEAGFIDKCAAEITESVEKLKSSKQFQNCKWLV